MLTVVRSYSKLFCVYIKSNLSSAMEYRISFITQVFGMMLNNVCFILFWWILFQRLNNIGGYTFTDIMFIWAISPSAFGFYAVFFGNTRNLSNAINNGELDTYILQPKDVFINFILGKTVVSGWGDFLYGYALMAIVFHANLMQFLLFTALVIIGGFFFVAIVAIGETLTFFMESNNPLGRLLEEFIITLSIYPDTIFSNWIKWLIYSILPTAFMVFIPKKIFFAFSWKWLVILVVIDILYVSFAYWLFNKGLKKYESGNLITSRL